MEKIDSTTRLDPSSASLEKHAVRVVYVVHTVQRKTIDFPETFDIPAPQNLQERSTHPKRVFWNSPCSAPILLPSALFRRDVAP
jgi:hypothetical protein